MIARDVSTMAPLTPPAPAPANDRIPKLTSPEAPLANEEPAAPEKEFDLKNSHKLTV